MIWLILVIGLIAGGCFARSLYNKYDAERRRQSIPEDDTARDQYVRRDDYGDDPLNDRYDEDFLDLLDEEDDLDDEMDEMDQLEDELDNDDKYRYYK